MIKQAIRTTSGKLIFPFKVNEVQSEKVKYGLSIFELGIPNE
jgi:hypothetical protein